MRERRGSSSSDRQIAYAAQEKRIVIFHTVMRIVHGWVVGLDDFHYVVVEPGEDRVVLIHKSCPLIVVGDTSEPVHNSVAQKMLASFQRHLTQGEPS